MGAKLYPAYRDSGVEWIGEIPEHWEVKRVADLSTLVNGHPFASTGFTQDPGLPLVRIRDLTSVNFTTFWNQPYPTTSLIKQDDIVIGMDGDFNCIWWNRGDALLNQRLCLLRFSQGFSSRYAYYNLGYPLTAINEVTFYTTVKHLSSTQVKSIRIPSPPLEEQKQIAAFLDRETSKIDTLIEKQQQLINLLKEKRGSLISHTVTKGLNPNAPMKDSGVEWIGEIPKHWEVKPLRHLGRCQNGLNIGGDAFGSGSPFVSYSDVYKNTVLPSAVKGLVESSETDWISYSVQRGDVLFTRTSETIDDIGMASTCLETIPKATFAGFLIRFRPIRSLDCRFSKHYFSNPRIRAFFAGQMVIITRASLSQDLLKQLPVLLPPESEQIEIFDFLDRETGKIDDLVIKANQSIALLKERRSSVISAAVTGKIDVRGVA